VDIIFELFRDGLFARLLIAHILTDFLFQPDQWIRDKRANHWHARYLYVHGMLAGVLACLFAGVWGAWWIGVLVGITHILIDGLKSYYGDTTPAFLADQAAHTGVLFIVGCMFLNNDLTGTLRQVMIQLSGMDLWTVILGYLLVLWPAGVLIGKFTRQWREKIEKSTGEINTEVSLEHAGKWIGYLERFLILSFILIGQYTAIGFLVAAKSVFRYSDRRDAGEYILIGTLLSFTVAISVGMVVRWITG
jgi:Protein of unknown function (DUF3307)